jgi:hypothetical protein
MLRHGFVKGNPDGVLSSLDKRTAEWDVRRIKDCSPEFTRTKKYAYFCEKKFMVRNLFQPLLRHLLKKEFTIMTGARQTGKSTLLKQLNEHCRKTGIPAVFLNLENKNVLAHF